MIFRPGLISHPEHEMSPQEHALSQRVLEFLIAQQDWFMLGISPPTPGSSADDLSRSGGSRGAGNGGKYGGPGSGSGSAHGHGGPSRKGTMNSTTGPEAPSSGTAGGGPTSGAAWNLNTDAGPSHRQQRTPVMNSPTPTWSPATQQTVQFTPVQPPSPSTQGGQLTEQITPTSSVPPSPTATTFDKGRSRSNSSATIQSQGTGSHGTPVLTHQVPSQIRASSPLNPTVSFFQPPRRRSRSPPLPPTPAASLPSEVDELMVIPYAGSVRSAEDDSASTYVPGGGGWRLVAFDVPNQAPTGWGHQSGGGGGFMALGGSRKDKEEKERIKMMRRRTTMDRTGKFSVELYAHTPF